MIADKVMEWHDELPAKLRDKKWFLIKRRKSIRSSGADTRRKKPTTANRQRLSAAIQEAMRRMPNVYKDSVLHPEELAKFPDDGEQEMLEQDEHVELQGDVRMDSAMFCTWLKLGVEKDLGCHCAQAIMRFATDQQGVDMRGGVSGETAWEMFCRFLSEPVDIHTLGTSDVAQLLVYWLEERQLPAEMREALYAGMLEDLEKRGKKVMTADDEQCMKSRWVKQTIHKELDQVREVWLSRNGEAPVDLEVEGGIGQGEATSMVAEAEQEAQKLLAAAQGETLSGRDEQNGVDASAFLDDAWGIDASAFLDDAEWLEEQRLAELAAEQPTISPDPHASASTERSALLAGRGSSTTVEASVLGLLPGSSLSAGPETVASLPGSSPSATGETSVLHLLPCSSPRAAAETSALLPGSSPRAIAGSSNETAGAQQAAAQEQAHDGKPLVEPPEFDRRVRDTDKEPFWIPGAFPTIFQNETGDPYNYVNKEVDLNTWGPHVMRSKGWHAQAHMTFMYWWMNMIHRIKALGAKKWYVKDNPEATGYTAADLQKLNVKTLSRRMVGYTAKIPGTKASKAHMRKVVLAMVRQIEIETRDLGHNGAEPGGQQHLGDVPCLFGTLTSQRYHWDQVIKVIAEKEGIPDYTALSKSKRRELVNKYPLFVAWYGSVRLELVLKTVVVPVFGSHAYFGVFEWSPTGGMVHLHYILWKSRAPRFDVRAEKLLADAEALRKAGVVASAQVECEIADVVDFFADYVAEWNPNKNTLGEEEKCHVAEDVNEAEPHPASLSIEEMLGLLNDDPESAHARFQYYKRAVRTEHLHDFHYPDPLGPPNPTQPCAKLLKGTLNMWYCGNGYPRDVVPKPSDQSIGQDALRPDLWRVNLLRNCQLMNPHIPIIPFVDQSNSDASPVVTKNQAEMYCCKYCTQHGKGQCRRNVLYDVLDDMERKDQHGKEKFGDAYKESKLGSGVTKRVVRIKGCWCFRGMAWIMMIV